MKNKTKKSAISNKFISYGIVVAAFILVQIFEATGMMSNQLQGLLVPVCVYVIAALSLNLVVGISGELSLGHAGFMCIGAFSSALFSNLIGDSINTGIRFLLAILVGALVAGIFGLLIGIPVLRLKGDYLAIVTLAFGEIIKNLMNIVYVGKDAAGIHFSLTSAGSMHMATDGKVIINGAQGITGTPKNSTFIIGVILVLVTLFIILNLISSRTGRAIMSIRDNRIAAESIGINITRYKLLAFSVSAALAGIAGVLYAHNLSSLTAKKFDYNTSILILVFVVLGGIGNMWGSIIAAVLLYVLPELLRGLSDYRMLIYAILLIIIMLFGSAPAAIALREQLKAKLFGRKQTAAKEEK